MAVAFLMEWDHPVKEARVKEYRKESLAVSEYTRKKQKEGIIKNSSSWSDGTGHIVAWFEFENVEAFAKFWGDEEFASLSRRFYLLVDYMRVRLLRPAVLVKED